MATYAAALDDALSTFKATGTAAELPQLFSDLAHQGVNAGLEGQALTALVELLSKKIVSGKQAMSTANYLTERL
jgi:hypothetical protein